MSCPTCSHTMEALGTIGQRVIAVCPRCGTIKDGPWSDNSRKVYVPKLVERCRAFERQHIPVTSGYMTLWKREGSAESINPPGKRPGDGGAK